MSNVKAVDHCAIASSTVQSGFSPLYAACEKDHSEVVDTLLKSGADPNLTSKV